MRFIFGYIGLGIFVIKYWYDVIELCVKFFVSNMREKLCLLFGEELEIVIEKVIF